MKMKRFMFVGLMSFAAVVALSGHTGDPSLDGKYHPQSHSRSHTSTVTILNPALFHRLNSVLEPVLIQGK